MKQNLNKQNGGKCDSNYVVVIGSFNQTSDKIIISDPSYEYIPKEHKNQII